jgi:hypothetical protein
LEAPAPPFLHAARKAVMPSTINPVAHQDSFRTRNNSRRIGDVNCDSAEQSKCLTDAKNTIRVNSIEGQKPVVGIEPTTQRLRSACSTTELHRHEKSQPIYQDSDTVK